MTDIDGLIELLKPHVSGTACLCESGSCELTSCRDCKAKRLADHLLANGVFILPEDLRGSEDFSISAFIEAMQMYKEKDRYIKPPCKVEQEVFCLIQGFENPLKAKVKKIVMQESGVVISCSIYGYFGHSFMATDFGKTVFLTKEEAEEKLQELKE